VGTEQEVAARPAAGRIGSDHGLNRFESFKLTRNGCG
jgi:hypothetical protein